MSLRPVRSAPLGDADPSDALAHARQADAEAGHFQKAASISITDPAELSKTALPQNYSNHC